MLEEDQIGKAMRPELLSKSFELLQSVMINIVTIEALTGEDLHKLKNILIKARNIVNKM